MSDKRIGILILAAGGSSRMGRPKQLLQFNGTSLVRRAAKIAIEAGGQPIVMVTGAAEQEVAAEVRDLPVRVVTNTTWEEGMGLSIRIGVEELLKSEANLEALIITLCDQPEVSAATLRKLVTAYLETGKPLCAASFADTVSPPALFAKPFFDELISISPRHGAKQILLSHAADLQRIDCPEAARDIDTPADYADFEAAPRRASLNP